MRKKLGLDHIMTQHIHDHTNLLKLMGIQAWYPRYPLANAAPSRALTPPLTSPPLTPPQQVDLASNEPTDEPPTEPLTETPSTAVAATAPTEQTPVAPEPSVAIDETTPSLGNVVELEWDKVWIISHRDDAEPMPKDEARLLHDIATALGARKHLGTRAHKDESEAFYKGLLKEHNSQRRVVIQGDALNDVANVIRIPASGDLLNSIKTKRALWQQLASCLSAD